MMDKWLGHPIIVRVLSLTIGVLLWAVVHFDQDQSPKVVANLTQTQEYTLQVEPIGQNDHAYVRTLTPREVKIKVRGTGVELLESANDYHVLVDISDLSEGIHELPVTVNLPRTIDLVSIYPRTVTVDLEQLVTQSFPVELNVEGTPATNYVTGIPEISPREVFVTLPKSQMEQVGFVGVSVNVDGEEETVKKKKVSVTVLDKMNEEIEGAVVEPQTVNVLVPITLPSKVVPLKVSYKGVPKNNLAVSKVVVSPETVTIFGTKEQLSQVVSYDKMALDLGQFKQAGTVEVELSSEDDSFSMLPNKVKVLVTLEAAKSKTIPQVPVTFSGLSTQLSASIAQNQPTTYAITVTGASNILNKVTMNNLQLTADLSGLKAGTHKVPLKLSTPQWVSWLNNQKLTATITIKKRNNL